MIQQKIIIIGSGIGGLTAAAKLSHHGYDVHIFEYAGKLGGYINPFKRKKYIFSPGMHIITEGKNSEFDKHLRSIGIHLDFIKLNENGFETHYFPNHKIFMTKNQDIYFNKLKAHFPQNKKEIERVYKKIKKLGREYKWLNNQPIATLWEKIKLFGKLLFRISPILKYYNYTWQKFIDRFITNYELKAILSAWCNAMGMMPDKVSVFAGIGYYADFADNGGWYLKDGTGAIRDKIKNKLIENKAKIYLNTKVRKIVVENKQVKGIILEKDNTFVPGDIIISNADPKQTYSELLSDVRKPNMIKKLLKNYQSSIGFYYLGIVIDTKGINNNILVSGDIMRYFASYDINAHFDFEQVKKGEGPYIFLSCPSCREEQKYEENTQLIEIVSSMPYCAVAKWIDYPINKRGSDYENVKKQMFNRIMYRLKTFLPDIEQRIKLKVDATPATNYNYTLNTGGAGVGMAITPAQLINRAPIKSHIKGLYNVGSGTSYGLGVIRCAKSGWEAARQILKAYSNIHYQP